MPPPITWIVATIGASVVAAWLVSSNIHRLGVHSPETHSHSHAAASPRGEGDTFHDWLHQKLEITPEQETRLQPIETAYENQRTELLHRVESAGHRLADALGGTPPDREALSRILTEIHGAQAQLQELTITHFLEMKEHLSPDQATQLLQWTRESITHEQRP